MMKIDQLMTRPVLTCRPSDGLDAAARIMWEHDCGCVPVVVPADGDDRVVGMITDRDVCMAAYTQGLPLTAIPVEAAMAHEVRSCRPTDSVGDALRILAGNQIRRLPVLDAGGLLVGMVSLADLAREAAREHGRKAPDVSDAGVGAVVEAISSRRSGEVAVVAA
jgi:CBS domain-containing protein